MYIVVKSTAFGDGEMIPKEFTCNGEGKSPPLEWISPSDNVQSFALICEDPDAPLGTFTHWVLYDLPPDVHGLPERVPNDETLSNGGVHGTNSMRRSGYVAPCPPRGTHRYFFRVFALDKKLGLDPGAGKEKVLKAMQGHVLGEGELMGLYKRQ